MTDERCKEIMESLGMPNSRSLKLALEQVANETAQYWQKKTAAEACRIAAENGCTDHRFMCAVRVSKAIADAFDL